MMAAALTPTLINKDFQNWLKGALAVLFAKEGLLDLVGYEIIDFQRHVLQTVYKQKGIPHGTTCSSCTTANVLACPTEGFCSNGKRCKAHDSKVPDKKPNIACPNGLCLHIRDAVKNDHRFKGPSWKNTDARRWCTDAFSLSKCFMPPDGYSDKTCLADTDFNGILAVVINNNRFQQKISVNLGLEPNICSEARNIGRAIRHSANHLLSDHDLMKYIDDLITLLSDPVYLAADVQARKAVGKLKQLKTNTLTIHADDITNVLNESIKTKFDDKQKVCLHNIQEHFKNHQKDSVELIDKKIQEFVDKQIAELKAETDRGKEELNAEKEKGKTELEIQSKTEKDELQSQLVQGKDILNTYTNKGKDELQTQLEQGKDILNTYTNKGKDELKSQLEQGKDILNSYTSKGKDELQSQFEQGKDVLNTYTNKGKDELQSQLEQGKDVLNTYKNKSKDELQTQLEQGKGLLNTYTKKGKYELQAELEHGKDVLNTEITMANIAFNMQTKTIEHKLNDLDESIVIYTRTVNNVKHTCIDELRDETIAGKQELEVHRKHVLAQINRYKDINTGENGDKIFTGTKTKKRQFGFWDKLTFKKSRLKSEFKEELVRFYNEKESMIPASPLVEDHAVPLTDLYVQPPIFALKKPNAFGQGNTPLEKERISSYRELFLNDDTSTYANIYIEANAGYGKTSFTQKVAMTWCQAHKPNKLMKSKFKQEDVDTLKRFEYLFLLHLRDFQGDTCNLDDLIFEFASQNWPNKDQFSEQFIAKILQTKTCLVIIDGLDEWVHPETCTRTPMIPHNNFHRNCTILTTARPWKLSTIGLPPNMIDRHLQISELDDKTYKELKQNAVKLLSKNSGTHRPDFTDFDSKVSSVKLGDICMIPYILLQLICIWFDGLSIGKSKCETYSNTIELTLERGLKKKNVPNLSTGHAERNATAPECLRHNVLCNQYMNLLFKLGKLAFYALFQIIKESRLVIESTIVLKFLTEKELEFCLKIGLLSQSIDRSKVSVKRYKVSFQHKSTQEFFAALYITSESENENIKSTIVEVCLSFTSILEMGNLFAFVCGINPEVYTCISGELQKIVDLDSSICRNMTYLHIDLFDDASIPMKSYQSMQVECLQESLRNGNDSCPIPLYFVLDNHTHVYDVKALKSIMQMNESSGVSPQVSLNENIVAFMLSKYHKFVFMKSLNPGEFTILETLRVEYRKKEPVWLADILTESARILKCLTLSLEYSFLTGSSLNALTGLACLQSLCLHNVNITHRNLKCLYAYIGQTTTLTHLKLLGIHCQDGRSHLYCDVTLDLHRLNKLELVVLEALHMSFDAWLKLLLSVGGLPQPVKVVLSLCQGISVPGWLIIVNAINSTPTLSVLPNILLGFDWAYMTIENKPAYSLC